MHDPSLLLLVVVDTGLGNVPVHYNYANSASNEEVKNIDIPASIGGGLEGTGEGATRRFLYC